MKKQLRNLTLATAAMMMAGSAYAQTAVTPGAGTANPFAYALSSTSQEGVVTVNYSLNADATAVTLIVKNQQGETVITQSLSGITKGAHTATFDLAGQETSCYTWEIQVTGAAKSTVEMFQNWSFYHPAGLEVDNSMESPSFGTLFIAEGYTDGKTTGYESAQADGSEGNGLYMYTAGGDKIVNAATGSSRFYASGLTFDKSMHKSTSGADFNQVSVSDDGRIFVSRYNDSGDYILTASSVADLVNGGDFTSLVAGKTMTNCIYNDADGNFLVGPVQGLDVKGSGDDIQIIALTRADTTNSVGTTPNRVIEYAIGTAAVLPTGTANSALDKKYTISYDRSANLRYDNRGGVWYIQYRGAPDNTNPALVYVDANGDVKYFEGAGGKVRRRGGLAVSPDGTQLAAASAAKVVSVYDINYAEDGAVTLTETYTITVGGSNTYSLAWDNAGNLYAGNASSEYVKGLSIPRADNNFTTKAAAQYSICYTKPVAPLYAVGAGDALGAWAPENAVEFAFDDTNYVLTVDETATEFKISTSKGTWDEFNAGNLAIDAAITNGGTVNLSVNKDGANIVLPWAGVWTITVAADLSTLTATTETPEPAPSYPEAVYLVGYNGAWDPAAPLEIAGENGVYTVEAVEFTSTEFKLSTAQGTWDEFNAGAKSIVDGATVQIGTAANLTAGDANIVIAVAGTYDVTVDLANNTITLTGVVSYPEEIYAIGNVGGYNWSTSEGIAIAHEGDGVYKGKIVVNDSGDGNGYFQFATILGADWDAVNAGTRYGALTANEAVVFDTAISMTNNWAGGTQSWMVKAGEFGVIVDIVNCTVTISDLTNGIEGINANDTEAPAVYYNLQGVEVENPETGNVYIKVVDGKATKVVK